MLIGSVAASVGLYFMPGARGFYNVIYFWLASILIDIDHYLDYIYNNRFTDYSFKRMMAYHGLLYKRRFDPAFINLSIFHYRGEYGRTFDYIIYRLHRALIYMVGLSYSI